MNVKLYPYKAEFEALQREVFIETPLIFIIFHLLGEIPSADGSLG